MATIRSIIKKSWAVTTKTANLGLEVVDAAVNVVTETVELSTKGVNQLNQHNFSKVGDYCTGASQAMQCSLRGLTREELVLEIQAYARLSEDERKEYRIKAGFDNVTSFNNWIIQLFDEEEDTKAQPKNSNHLSLQKL
jgi:hypothetical protein